MADAHEWKHNRYHTKCSIQNSPDTYTCQQIVGKSSKWTLTERIPVEEVLSEYYAANLNILADTRFESENHSQMLIYCINIDTYLSRSSGTLGCGICDRVISNVGLMCSRRPCTLFEGDALCEGDGNGIGSFTGTWVIRLPRWVCVTVTSNMLGFCPESLIFGIKQQVYGGMVEYNRKRWKLVIDWLINWTALEPVQWFVYCYIHPRGG